MDPQQWRLVVKFMLIVLKALVILEENEQLSWEVDSIEIELNDELR